MKNKRLMLLSGLLAIVAGILTKNLVFELVGFTFVIISSEKKNEIED